MKKIIILTLIMLIYLLSKKHISKEISNNSKIQLLLTSTQDILELDKEEYIKGVVLAEMPSSFSLEALKAQAVAARTYTNKKFLSENHICDNPSHCQAWSNPSTSAYYEKISQAVLDTVFEEITYLGVPIDAFFHSASGGKTENSENVWSSSKPYLISVDSPGEDKIMESFFSEKEVTYLELCEKINKHKGKKLVSPSNLKNKIEILSYTDGNRVKEIKIQDSTFSGIEIRNIFGLKSANFDIELKDKSIIFNVRGYGHGVGMSQWGAEVMARDGANYKEILCHYYPGTKVEKIK